MLTGRRRPLQQTESSPDAHSGSPARAPRQKPVGRRRLVLPGALVVANTAVFLFQIMLARIASAANFGEIMAVLMVLVVLDAPSSALQAVVSKAVQRSGLARGLGTDDIGSLFVRAAMGAVAFGALLIPLAVLLKSLLHLSHTPWLIAVYGVPLILGVVPKGLLAGLGDVGGIAAGLVATTVVRLVVGTVLVHSGYGDNGALGAVVIGEVIAVGVLLVAVKRRCEPERSQRPADTRLEVRWGDALGEGASSMGFWALAVFDVITARHFVSVGESGQYAAAATLAQVVMILPAGAAAFAFPRLVGSRGPRPRRGQWRRVAAAIGLLLAGLAVLMGVFAGPLLRLVFGGGDRPPESVTFALLASAAFLGLVMVLVQFLLARKEALPASLTWLGLAGFTLAVWFDHASMVAIADAEVLASAATCLVLVTVALQGQRYTRVRGAEPLDLSADSAGLDLTVVVPYYNPGEALAPNIRRLLDVLGSSSLAFEVIAVSDGSTDGSEATIRDLEGDALRHVVLAVNQGKGAALRVGLAAGRGRYLGFIDADGDLDPQLLKAFLALVDLYQPDVVVGSKRHPLSKVHYPPLRWVYSIGFQYLVKVMFRLDVTDTQTGIKLVRRDVLAAVLPRMMEKRFAFDLEMLAVARRLGYRRMLEAPVEIEQRFSSTVSIRSVFHTLVDTLAIFYRMRFLRTYDRAVSQEELDLRVTPRFVRIGQNYGGA